jgi:hypothetical protein
LGLVGPGTAANQFGTYHPLAGAKSTMEGFISEQRASYPKDDLDRAGPWPCEVPEVK